MLSPYENIVIGNFLYGLGLVMGRDPMPVDGCVNLLQQTPLDKVLGDVMLQFPGAWRLIEFKRVGANLRKERVKLQTYVGATRRDAALRQASLRAHWFVQTGPQVVDGFRRQEFEMVVRPYLDLEGRGGMSLTDFARTVVDDARHGTVLQHELDLYLRLIKLFGSLDGFNTSGLLVGVNGDGGLVYLPLDNIADLTATAGLLLERLRQREVQFFADQASRGPFSIEVRRHLQQRREAASRQTTERVLERELNSRR